MIDIFNRTIFDQLGFHDAFITRSFETRFVLRFLFPFWFCYVNAINAAKHFNRKVYPALLAKRYVRFEEIG